MVGFAKSLPPIIDGLASAQKPRHAIVIGPEGGWRPKRCPSSPNNGWQPDTLGPHIIRTETAAIAAIEIVSTHVT
jgi:16S rRNA (uracil1498-N3)-methyltransferase